MILFSQPVGLSAFTGNPQMNLPAGYELFLSRLPQLEVVFGVGGIQLFPISALEAAQAGYAVGPQGQSLCGEAEGQWKSTWTVIGIETSLGDPIFVDSTSPESPVFSAQHGEGAWSPIPIATSLGTLAKILAEYGVMAEYRESLENLEEDNPKCVAFVERVEKLNDGKIKNEFWPSMLAS